MIAMLIVGMVLGEAPVRFLHLLAAAYWLGGLAFLALVVGVGLRTLDPEAFRRLIVPLAQAFAWGSVVAWLVLAGTGYILASHRLPGLAVLASTAYGRRLGLKLGLVALTLLATALHVVLGRSASRWLLLISRGMAVAAFALTLGVFYAAARLVSG